MSQDPQSASEPWAQRGDESNLQYARFLVYRDLGPDRTIEAAAEALNAGGQKVALSYLKGISGRYAWSRRAGAFDGRPPPPPKPFRLAGDRDPWERQPDEPEVMYSRFATYLELGRTRTLTATAGILTALGDLKGKTTNVYLRELSARYLWTQRVGAYDREQDRVERERLIEQRRDMIKRHRAIANDLSAKAKEALSKLKVDKITPLDMVRMLRLAAVIESTALGMPFETVALTGPGGTGLLVDDLSSYTDEERRARYQEIAAEIAQRASAPVDDMNQEDE